MNFFAILNRVLLLISVGVTLVTCDDNNDNNSANNYLPITTPTVELPPEVGSISFLGTFFDLGELGYTQSEYFLSGMATAFSNLTELGEDGQWEVEPGSIADYRTRVVINRPIDDADFSGTVIVEWLNVTSGFEIPPSWMAGHTEMLRAGHVWIGVSAQYIGIEGSENGLLPLYLKAVDPERYDSLLHPGDSYSYDMYSQVVQAIREPQDIDILGGLQPLQLLAFGESQSAGRLVTYINAVHPLYNPYDGYMVHSRGGSSAPLTQTPLVEIPTPAVVRVREDLNVPVLTYETETDLFILGFITSRQQDSDLFRLWEVAGTAHADYYTTTAGRLDTGTGAQFAVVVEETSVQGVLECPKPLNSGPQAWTFNAAVNALDNWVASGVLPPQADRMKVTDDMSGFVYDDNGNVRGGIRTPYVDAPPAILSGEGQTGGGFCFLFGTTHLFDAATMAALYIDKAGYIQAVSDATNEAIDKGFLLSPDGERIKAAASLQWDMLGI